MTNIVLLSLTLHTNMHFSGGCHQHSPKAETVGTNGMVWFSCQHGEVRQVATFGYLDGIQHTNPVPLMSSAVFTAPITRHFDGRFEFGQTNYHAKR